MKSFTAVYFHQVNQYLSQPLHFHSIYETIIQEILNNSAQMNVYIFFSSNSIYKPQEIIQTNNLITFKNNIIFVSMSYNSNQTEPREFVIEEETIIKSKNLRYFNCRLNQNENSLLVHKIINQINQLFFNCPMPSSKTESSIQKIEPKISINKQTTISNTPRLEDNFKNAERNKSSQLLYKNTNKIPQSFIINKFCDETILSKDLSFNFKKFAISNILGSQKSITDTTQEYKIEKKDTSLNSCFSQIYPNQKSSNYKNLINTPCIEMTKVDYLKKMCQNQKKEGFNFAECAIKKMKKFNMFDQNNQATLNYQVQIFGAFENEDPDSINFSELEAQYQNIFSSNQSFNQNEFEKLNLTESCNLIIALEGEEYPSHLQMQKIGSEQIIWVPKSKFDEFIKSLMCRIAENSPNDFVISQEPPIPDGIVCIKLSLLQQEVQNSSSGKLISLINLLKNSFNFFTYIYSEEPHQKQQEMIKEFQSKLEICGLIFVNSNEKASKHYDPSMNQYFYTFPNMMNIWHDFFEINRNYVFCIDDIENKITVLIYEELFEYQNLFQALSKIYEDRLILKIFDKQDKISQKKEKLLYDSTEFILNLNYQQLSNKHEFIQLFLRAQNTNQGFIGTIDQPYHMEAQNRDEIIQYKKVFALRMYSFFGVNTPYCCLSYQSASPPINKKCSDDNNNSSKLYLMTECISKCQSIPKSFLSHYKKNANQYFYYPSAIKEGPLIGFGSSLLAAFLLNEIDFFGNEFQNNCFIKRDGYFEFTKLAINKIFFADHNDKGEASINEDTDIILVMNNECEITFADLCEYDKFEFVLQVSKLRDSDSFGEEIWTQFIDTKFSEQFKQFESEWTLRMQRVTKYLLKEDRNDTNLSTKRDSLLQHYSVSQNSCKNYHATSFSNPLNKKSIFFTRKQKYIAEQKNLGAGSFGAVSVAYLVKNPTKKFALKRLFDNKHILRETGEINAGKESVDCNYKEEHDRELEALVKIKRIKSPFLIEYVGAQLLKHEIKGTHRLELIMELCDGDLTSFLKNLKKKKKKTILI